MNRGRVYVWSRDPDAPLGGRVTPTVAPLLRLDPAGQENGRLSGRFVRVRNAGRFSERDPASGAVRGVAIGDAEPNPDGDFFFESGIGGGRLDKVFLADAGFRWRYVQASHFGEVNTYFHLDRIAAHIDHCLCELGAASLPRVTAVVNAHHAATEINGIRDGVRRGERWVALQGGHYRLPSRRYDVREYEAVSVDGEIHLGPGRELLLQGALAEAAGGRYRANASHNAGILYHEYGHHIARHSADFRANALRDPARQDNRKSALDEGFADYWAAVMLDTPHIWAWHRHHSTDDVHPRSLCSNKTMAQYDWSPAADAHANGTIWAAALWDLRRQLAAAAPDGAWRADLLVLQSLIVIGHLLDDRSEPTARRTRAVRERHATALRALLYADHLLNADRHAKIIRTVFAARGIQAEETRNHELRAMEEVPVVPSSPGRTAGGSQRA